MFNLAQSNTFILFQKSKIKKKFHYIKPNCSIHKYIVKNSRKFTPLFQVQQKFDFILNKKRI